MRMLHKRLPVVLQERDQPRWLGEVDDDTGRLMYPTGDNLLHLWPVSRAVNSVRNNGVELLLDWIDDPATPSPSDAPAGQSPA